ncbi:hypothetical protein FXF51_23850 [Nonomuraea sp. PA05]|uniref:hypothetical protein n=1 Tax=Nonomuraea sp. PA05 TaxID=2604466 RepID=UPI0011D811E5|nr:hypothetical protein [Nonomuraea sp. PA05]TYB63223.1 hypothetical protein FXF51_23850 [Nonomuraea sp. PA05]
MRRVLLMALALTGMTGISVALLGLADARVDAVRRVEENLTPGCPPLPYGEVHRTTRLKIHDSDVNVPLLISTTVATVARHSTLAQPLLTGPRERRYQELVGCLLGASPSGWQWEERRASMPLVTVENDAVVVTDTVRIDSDDLTAADYKQFGPWTFYREASNEHWSFDLPASGLMPWYDVTVEAPSRWLLNARPLPHSTDSRRTVWWHPPALVSFTLLPDPETRIAAAVNQHPIRAVMVHFWDLVILLLALACTRTVELRRSRWPEPAGQPDPAHDARAMRVRQASAVRARRRRRWRARSRLRVFAVPCLFVALAGGGTLVEELIDESASSYWWGSAVVLVVSVLVLWAGHVLRPSTAVAMAAVAAAYAGIGLSEPAFPDRLPSSGWTPAVSIAAALLLLVLLMSAVLNGARLAWNEPAHPPDDAAWAAAPPWVWRAATAMAALVVGYACYALARDRVWAGWLVADLSLLEGGDVGSALAAAAGGEMAVRRPVVDLAAGGSGRMAARAGRRPSRQG